MIKKIAWVAGLLEGEGCFTASPPCIQIAMTDLDVILKFKSVVGGDNFITTTNLPSGKKSYKIKLNGTRAIQWMMTVYSLMGVRRQQKIREVISQWRTKYACEK